jgi:hypothetical protein
LKFYALAFLLQKIMIQKNKKSTLKKILSTICIMAGTAFVSVSAQAQQEYPIQNSDYSDIWDSYIQEITSGDCWQGIIGDNYQRIEIKFLTVKRVENDSSRYIITGKSKVNSNICNFEGYIQVTGINYTVRDGNIYSDDGEIIDSYNLGDDTLRGEFYAEYKLYENRKQPNSGMFEGELVGSFGDCNPEIDGCDHYTDGDSDGFKGTWSSYKTNKTKICKWGRYFPPDTYDLFRHIENDAYGFNYKYLNMGWESYIYSSFFIPLNFETEEYIDDWENDYLSLEEKRKKALEIESKDF